MSYRNKKIVSAIVASLITVTPNLCAKEVKRNSSNNNKDCSFLRLSGYLPLGISGILLGKKIYNYYYGDNDADEEYIPEKFHPNSDNKQDENQNEKDEHEHEHKNTSERPSLNLLSLAVKRYRSEFVNEQESDGYLTRFSRCYRAAAILYGLDRLGKENRELENTTLCGIVDDILTIPGIDQMYVWPRRMVAFYVLSHCKGNFDDLNKWVDISRKARTEFFQGKSFPIMALTIGGWLFDLRSERDIRECLQGTMMKIQKKGNSWSLTSRVYHSEIGLSDFLELTISPDNKKTLHYVYHSPSCRRSCDLLYEF